MSMNNINILGRLARDVDYRVSGSGVAVARFTLAVAGYKKKDGAQDTEWLPCVAFGKTAELLDKYFGKDKGKGRQLGVTGRLKSGSYTDKDGKKVYTLDVNVDQIHFVGSKNDSVNSQTTTEQDYQEPAQVNEQGFVQVQDDDLPF